MTHSSLIFVVIGTCGVGKSTIANALAIKFKGLFIEADDFHPAENIACMSRGIALTDEMRWQWLDNLAQEINQQHQRHHPLNPLIFVACSALKKRYRQHLRTRLGKIHTLYLNADPEIIRLRMQSRKNHFMPLSLLDSQLRDLEPPSATEEMAYDIDANGDPSSIIQNAARLIKQQLDTSP